MKVTAKRDFEFEVETTGLVEYERQNHITVKVPQGANIEVESSWFGNTYSYEGYKIPLTKQIHLHKEK